MLIMSLFDQVLLGMMWLPGQLALTSMHALSTVWMKVQQEEYLLYIIRDFRKERMLIVTVVS